MKKLLPLGLVMCLFFVGCKSYKQVPYFQDSELIDYTNNVQELYDAKIMPKDLLTIVVNTSDPEASAPYNLITQTRYNTQQRNTLTTQASLIEYLVDNDGNIIFPQVGTIHVAGLTKTQCEQMLVQKLSAFLKETPIVTVRMSNYKISVMGEVNHPGTFTVNNEKVNILEALAMAGDLTIHGLRKNVKLLREDASGKRSIVELDLNDPAIINSPYYYLQQNDIVYVTPNKTKAKNSEVGNITSYFISGTSILISIASLLVNILR